MDGIGSDQSISHLIYTKSKKIIHIQFIYSEIISKSRQI
jgi:hypothetical protein